MASVGPQSSYRAMGGVPASCRPTRHGRYGRGPGGRFHRRWSAASAAHSRGRRESMSSTSFQRTAALESAAGFGTLLARPCVAPLTRLSISKPLPSSLAAPSMMRAEVKYSPAPPEPSTEARSRTLLIIGLPGSRTNVVPNEAPPNKLYEPLRPPNNGLKQTGSRCARPALLRTATLWGTRCRAGKESHV